MSFVIHALPAAPFAPLFVLSPDELAARRGALRVADRCPGFPCRVSLRDAEIGETVVLVHYEHQPASSPFRASHAIDRMLSSRTAAYLHLHFAKPGCYAARVDRVACPA